MAITLTQSHRRSKNKIMARLKSREKFIPGGFKFYQPETKWQSPPFASFNTIVGGLVAHRQANPFLTQKHGWPVDPVQVAEEVDAYNAMMCQRMGWTDYFIEGGPDSPLSQPPHRHHLLVQSQRLAAGAKTLVDWIKDGSEAVPAELANKRAEICAGCPKNGTADLTSWFTMPVSQAIKAAISLRKDWNLSTPFDDKLGVCDACACPLHLKIHMPLDRILARLTDEVKRDLDARCWILKGT